MAEEPTPSPAWAAWWRPAWQAQRHRLLGGTLLAALGSAAWLAIPWAIGEIISFASTYQAPAPVAPLWQWLGLIGLVSLGYYLAQEVARYLVYLVAEEAAIDLQQRTLRHLTRLNLSWHEQENSGNKLKKISRGGQSLNQAIRLYINLGVDTLVSFVGIGLIFFQLDPALIGLLLLFFAVHAGLAWFLTGRAMAQSRAVNRGEEAFYGIKFELLNNITTVKTLDLAGQVMELIGHKTRRLLDDIRQRIVLFRTRLAILGLNQQLFRLVLIGYAAWQVIQGHFEVGLIAQVYFYFGKMEGVAKRFSDIYHQLVIIRIDLDGVSEILAAQPSVEDEGDQDFPPAWQALHLRDLHYAYGSGPAVLRGLDAHLHRGEKIGLVGASGAGKTTLFRLLQKLYPSYTGTIAFDGQDLRRIRRASYVPHTGVVLQDTELFNLSLRDNITLGKEPGPGDAERLTTVLDMAGLSTLLERLPQGLDTLVGEKGVRLSGGEKQRLGIARALFRQPQLLFLDEATSHLDSHTEAHVLRALHAHFPGVTTLVIAHRLATLTHMDRIWVLEAGRLVQAGTFEALRDSPGPFRVLWEAQQGS